MVKYRSIKSSLLLLQLILLSILLSAKTIKVPQDFSTIKQAVNMAEDGDTIEVDDGFYFEKNIIIDKKIHLKSKNLFGAVIDGGKVLYSSIFLIRSQTEIEGFVLKNSYYGILQRNSPDVLWVAHDMAILDMLKGAIYINDRDRNIGSASVKNILVDNSKTAFLTNDANRLEVTNCLVTNCFVVFNGSNHIDFSVNKISILNCEKITFSGGLIVEPTYPATHQINLGPEIHILDDIVKTNAKPNLKSAISTIFPAININRSDGLNNHNLDSMTLDVLGEVYLRLGDYDKATDLFQTAVSVGENTGSLDIVWDSYYGLAKISESQHRYQKALEYYEKSILAIENVRNKLPLMEYKTAYMKSRMKVYESLVHLLFRLHKSNPSNKYHEKAFCFVEKIKARALLDRFQESDIDLEACLDQHTKKEMNKILTEIAETQKALKNSSIPAQERNFLLKKLEEREDSFTSLMIRIKSNNQEYANLVSPNTSTYEDVKDRLLSDDTALIEYYIGVNDSFVFLATTENLYMERLQDPRFLKKMVRKYLYFLTLENNKEFKGIDGGKRLFSLLLGPIQDLLDQKIKRLIIIPDDSLMDLPFEALIQKDSTFLIEDFDISYAPSSSTLLNLTDRKIIKRRTMDLLALASNHSPLDFPPIQNATHEVNAISKFFDKKTRTLLTRNEATEKNLKSENLTNFKIIHFATHAIMDNKKWYRSALVLKPEKNSNDDSLLQPKDLITLKINSDLVVLSGCQTRQGKLEAGEGIFGLTRVFLYSGSKSVLSSLWRIDDRISPRFMKNFYKYLTLGQSKDSALRLAKKDMLRSKHCHPRYWAAFVLIGNSSPVFNKIISTQKK